MIWLFAGMSVVLFAIGILFMVSPKSTLFLLPQEQRDQMLQGSRYRWIARIGGFLMAFVCAPLNMLVGVLANLQ